MSAKTIDLYHVIFVEPITAEQVACGEFKCEANCEFCGEESDNLNDADQCSECSDKETAAERKKHAWMANVLKNYPEMKGGAA